MVSTKRNMLASTALRAQRPDATLNEPSSKFRPKFECTIRSLRSRYCIVPFRIVKAKLTLTFGVLERPFSATGCSLCARRYTDQFVQEEAEPTVVVPHSLCC